MPLLPRVFKSLLRRSLGFHHRWRLQTKTAGSWVYFHVYTRCKTHYITHSPALIWNYQNMALFKFHLKCLFSKCYPNFIFSFVWWCNCCWAIISFPAASQETWCYWTVNLSLMSGLISPDKINMTFAAQSLHICDLGLRSVHENRRKELVGLRNAVSYQRRAHESTKPKFIFFTNESRINSTIKAPRLAF